MLRYPIAEPEIGEEELRNVVEAVKSGWVSSKGEVHRGVREILCELHWG
jgi:dTDP-4-amino-4,6-dideoxygalactose transaminase